MSLKAIFVIAFAIVYYLLSNYVTAQISQLQSSSALALAFLIDIVIYFITAVFAVFLIQPKGAKENGRVMLWIITIFLLLHLSLNNTWSWILSWEYLLIILISYILAFLMGQLGFKVAAMETEKENKEKSIIKESKRITKKEATKKKPKSVKKAQKKKTAKKKTKKASKKTARKSAQ